MARQDIDRAWQTIPLRRAARRLVRGERHAPPTDTHFGAAHLEFLWQAHRLTAPMLENFCRSGVPHERALSVTDSRSPAEVFALVSDLRRQHPADDLRRVVHHRDDARLIEPRRADHSDGAEEPATRIAIGRDD